MLGFSDLAAVGQPRERAIAPDTGTSGHSIGTLRGRARRIGRSQQYLERKTLLGGLLHLPSGVFGSLFLPIAVSIATRR